MWLASDQATAARGFAPMNASHSTTMNSPK
jgi:hypothetical protein